MTHSLRINLSRLGGKKKAAPPLQSLPTKEFHVSRSAREKYDFDKQLFTSRGHVIFANFKASREFAKKINDLRDLIRHPEQAVKAGQINAMGLIDEILHYVITLYREDANPRAFALALDWLKEKISRKELDATLLRFVEEFPPREVFKGDMEPSVYLESSSEGVPNREVVLEELAMLWLANMNRGFRPCQELFDDSGLKKGSDYAQIIESLNAFFATQPRFGPDNQTLIELLRAPAVAHPDSLEDQLQFIRDKWGMMLGEFLLRLLLSLDLIKEENKAHFLGPPLLEIPEFSGLDYEPERFSPDQHWMPNLVLMAKSTLVWLDQLSNKYQRPIYRLDHVPDEELDMLARWGFTGLWLIGIWERSEASKSIKRMCGNPEAEASAYSLFDYEISAELGGYQALQNLKDRCWKRGIRLACDMVPNHTGLDSKWTREHPDWFISLPYSPFPSYTFHGHNFSQDQRYGIFIEDKYFNRTDAAVVFKREDYWTGDVRYIYHGNDATSTPWNDTAQLNFLNPETREAVIQKILHVARMFSVIRFDAAMTLSKKHYQRLWFPEPGGGGDIPSRAEHGMTRANFNNAMPNEFWREVVDRVAAEVPDTLLLAEAFWLMEGYFVRTLGMHRVYNSAFMNMLKNEENQKYRSTIKNTIQYNPEILKRYVNFMNNPDEDTAVAQFGKSDKYFGVCVMMVTMPGLPMFGHGQIEGFTEKYGMEYRRAYWNEEVDGGLVEHHERIIFPLLKRRYLFAEVANFLLYDFFAPEGYVNENVFAYSNRCGDERSLVIYNNKFEHARGWIRTSTAYAVKTGNGDEVRLVQRSLGDGLAFSNLAQDYLIFRDYITGLEYLRNCREIHEQGLYVELDAYKHHVFLDFRQVRDNEWSHYGQLKEHLNGAGVPSVDYALRELAYKPLLDAFDRLACRPMYESFLASRLTSVNTSVNTDYVRDFSENYRMFLEQVSRYSGCAGQLSWPQEQTQRRLLALMQLLTIERRFSWPKSLNYRHAMESLRSFLKDELSWQVAYAWLLVHATGEVKGSTQSEELSRSWLDQWPLGERLERLFRQLREGDMRVWQSRVLLNLLTTHQHWHHDRKPKRRMEVRILERLFRDREAQQFLNVNRFNGVLWFNKENFELLVSALFVTATVQITAEPEGTKTLVAKDISDAHGLTKKWLASASKASYQVEKLFEILQPKTRAVKT